MAALEASRCEYGIFRCQKIQKKKSHSSDFICLNSGLRLKKLLREERLTSRQIVYLEENKYALASNDGNLVISARIVSLVVGRISGPTFISRYARCS